MVIEGWPPDATTGPFVRLTKPDKVLYPATEGVAATTKVGVFGCYTTIAEGMLPHLAGRLATRVRWSAAHWCTLSVAACSPIMDSMTVTTKSPATHWLVWMPILLAAPDPAPSPAP